MLYESTRGSLDRMTGAQAIIRGIAPTRQLGYVANRWARKSQQAGFKSLRCRLTLRRRQRGWPPEKLDTKMLPFR